jgi:hypothetical protein
MCCGSVFGRQRGVSEPHESSAYSRVSRTNQASPGIVAQSTSLARTECRERWFVAWAWWSLRLEPQSQSRSCPRSGLLLPQVERSITSINQHKSRSRQTSEGARLDRTGLRKNTSSFYLLIHVMILSSSMYRYVYRSLSQVELVKCFQPPAKEDTPSTTWPQPSSGTPGTPSSRT